MFKLVEKCCSGTMRQGWPLSLCRRESLQRAGGGRKKSAGRFLWAGGVEGGEPGEWGDGAKHSLHQTVVTGAGFRLIPLWCWDTEPIL